MLNILRHVIVSIFPELPVSNILETLMPLYIEALKIPYSLHQGWGFPDLLDDLCMEVGCLLPRMLGMWRVLGVSLIDDVLSQHTNH